MIDIITLLEEIERLQAENDRLKTELYVGEIKRKIFRQQLHKKQHQGEEVMDDFIREAAHYVYYSKDLKCCVVPFHNLRDIKEDVLSKKGWW